MKALVRIKLVRRPISGECYAFRIEAAVPNNAGRKMLPVVRGDELVAFKATSDEVPSFKRPYTIAESSDIVEFSKRDLDRFRETLRWQGYRDVEWVGKFCGVPLSEFIAEKGW